MNETKLEMEINTLIAYWENPETKFLTIKQSRPITDQERHDLKHRIKDLVLSTLRTELAAKDKRIEVMEKLAKDAVQHLDDMSGWAEDGAAEYSWAKADVANDLAIIEQLKQRLAALTPPTEGNGEVK